VSINILQGITEHTLNSTRVRSRKVEERMTHCLMMVLLPEMWTRRVRKCWKTVLDPRDMSLHGDGVQQ
jgi:hypothetical protein